jgi:hypothetical protein
MLQLQASRVTEHFHTANENDKAFFKCNSECHSSALSEMGCTPMQFMKENVKIAKPSTQPKAGTGKRPKLADISNLG